MKYCKKCFKPVSSNMEFGHAEWCPENPIKKLEDVFGFKTYPQEEEKEDLTNK